MLLIPAEVRPPREADFLAAILAIKREEEALIVLAARRNRCRPSRRRSLTDARSRPRFARRSARPAQARRARFLV
jgi:hypothetical protein